MPRQLDLDQRLKHAAKYVRPNAVFADVGCDHGRLSVYLIQQCNALRGYACDIRPQPLEKAKKLIERNGLQERIIPVLTDGVQGLEENGITDVVIAGIGGEALAHIIEQAPFLQDENIRVILQPQSKEHILRKILYQLGFFIEEEQVVSCGRFLYTILVSRYCGIRRDISELESYTGVLTKDPSHLTLEKLKKTANTLKKIAQQMKDSPENYQDSIRIQHLSNEIERIAQQTKGR